MDSARADRDRHPESPSEPGPRPNGHDLIAVSEWLPGAEPTDADVELSNGREYRSRYWRCRACGEERNRRDEFETPCAVEGRPAPAFDGGYSIEDDRTRRALSGRLSVRFVRFGPGYAVETLDGERWFVDVEAEVCSCLDRDPDGAYCEHLRRVDLAIRTGELPGPDGRYVR